MPFGTLLVVSPEAPWLQLVVTIWNSDKTQLLFQITEQPKIRWCQVRRVRWMGYQHYSFFLKEHFNIVCLMGSCIVMVQLDAMQTRFRSLSSDIVEQWFETIVFVVGTRHCVAGFNHVNTFHPVVRKKTTNMFFLSVASVTDRPLLGSSSNETLPCLKRCNHSATVVYDK